jgi:hypothetical protein
MTSHPDAHPQERQSTLPYSDSNVEHLTGTVAATFASRDWNKWQCGLRATVTHSRRLLPAVS